MYESFSIKIFIYIYYLFKMSLNFILNIYFKNIYHQCQLYLQIYAWQYCKYIHKNYVL